MTTPYQATKEDYEEAKGEVIKEASLPSEEEKRMIFVETSKISPGDFGLTSSVEEIKEDYVPLSVGVGVFYGKSVRTVIAPNNEEIKQFILNLYDVPSRIFDHIPREILKDFDLANGLCEELRTELKLDREGNELVAELKEKSTGPLNYIGKLGRFSNSCINTTTMKRQEDHTNSVVLPYHPKIAKEAGKIASDFILEGFLGYLDHELTPRMKKIEGKEGLFSSETGLERLMKDEHLKNYLGFMIQMNDLKRLQGLLPEEIEEEDFEAREKVEGVLGEALTPFKAKDRWALYERRKWT